MTEGVEKPRAPSAWRPETDPVRLAILGKLLEEIGEGVSAIARCVIQGVDRSHPTTKKPNRRWLEEEVADMEAGLVILKAHFGLDQGFIAERRAVKIEHKREWHERIRRGESEDD